MSNQQPSFWLSFAPIVAFRSAKVAFYRRSKSNSKVLGLRLGQMTAFLLLVIAGCAESKNEPEAAPAATEAQTAEEAPTPESGAMIFERMSPLVREYQEAGEVLELNEEQRAALDDVQTKHKGLFESWCAVEGQELKSLQKSAMEAARTRDLARLRDATKKKRVADLIAQERDLQKAFESDLMAAIPADKMDQWKAYRISKLLLEFLEPLELTEKQITSVKELAPNAIQSLRPNQKANWQGYGTSNLEKQFENSVLTADQKEAFEKLKKSNAMRMLRWKNN